MGVWEGRPLPFPIENTYAEQLEPSLPSRRQAQVEGSGALEFRDEGLKYVRIDKANWCTKSTNCSVRNSWYGQGVGI